VVFRFQMVYIQTSGSQLVSRVETRQVRGMPTGPEYSIALAHGPVDRSALGATSWCCIKISNKAVQSR
jgi:hypothetical protein